MPRRKGKGVGQLPPRRQLCLCRAQGVDRRLRLGGQLLEVARPLRLLRLAQPALRRLAVDGDVRVLARDDAQELIDQLLILKVALLLTPVLEADDQIRDRTEHTLAGETALAHGDAFEDARHVVKRHIEVPVDIEAVEINCLLSDTAGADFPAGFVIFRQRVPLQRGRADEFGRKKHHAHSLKRGGSALPPLLGLGYLSAFFAARRKMARKATAATMPMGYATAVLFRSAAIMPRHSGAMTK